MNKRNKVRKSCLLCLSFVRNCAFYNASYADDGSHLVGGTVSLSNQFWNTTTGNFLDMAVIEWCKLFGNDQLEKHHWKKVVKDKARYKIQLLKMFEEGEVGWKAYWDGLQTYRNKFAAHLDEDNQYIVPYLHKAHELVINHYNYLLEHEVAEGFFREPPPNIQTYYQQQFDMARAVYDKQNG